MFAHASPMRVGMGVTTTLNTSTNTNANLLQRRSDIARFNVLGQDMVYDIEVSIVLSLFL